VFGVDLIAAAAGVGVEVAAGAAADDAAAALVAPYNVALYDEPVELGEHDDAPAHAPALAPAPAFNLPYDAIMAPLSLKPS
jgi:hypothetical protein